MRLSRKRKNWLIISVCVVLCGVTAFILLTRDGSTIEQNYHIEDVDTISRIIIEDKDGSKLSLVKKAKNDWEVNGRPANQTVVDEILFTFENMRIREPIARAARNNIIKQLASSGQKVQVYQDDYLVSLGFVKLFKKERLTRVFYIGMESQDNMGSYMMLKGENDPCVVHIPGFKGNLSTRFSAVEDNWRSHAVFKYGKDDIVSVKVEIPNDKKESFELEKNGDGFDFRLLESNKKLTEFDTVKVVALLSSCFELNYESVAKNISDIEKDTIFSKAPAFVFTIKDKNGKENKLTTYSKLYDPTSIAENDEDFYTIFDVNRCYGIHSQNKDTLIMQFFVLDNLMNPASYYFKSGN